MELKPNRHERYSEYTRRIKSHEQKVGEAAANLALCFGDKSNLTVTRSASGNERVRAHFPDEDGYAGWVENSYYAGVAFVRHGGQRKYVAEQHYPYKRSGLTYVWGFTLEIGALTFMRTEGGETTGPLNLPMPADEEHEAYFLQLTEDLARAHPLDDLEKPYSRQNYQFTLEDLR